MCGKSHPQYHREVGRTVRMNVQQSLVSGRAHRTRAVHEPPVRAGLARRNMCRGCTQVSGSATSARRDMAREPHGSRGRFTNRPYGCTCRDIAHGRG